MSFTPETETLAKPEALLRVPVGLASPLWGLFAGAAVTGATWWWMTRWARPQNLEAMFGAAARFEAAEEPEPASFAVPAVEALEVAQAIVEAAPQPVIDRVVEAAVEAVREPVKESVLEASPEPVAEAVEAAPAEPTRPPMEAAAPEVVGPIVEPIAEPVVVAGGATDVALAAAAPRPKKKVAAPKPD